jgi:proline iminopeptidase
MRLFRRFNAPLEKSFTVVYWDRRGTGKSFDSKSPRSSMTVEQFVADLDDLIDAVCKRVGRTRLRSPGTVGALLSACSMPLASQRSSRLMSAADRSATGQRARHHPMPLCSPKRRKALKALRATGPPPLCAPGRI